jgi:DNA-directed RNA polymerase subunit RPC12/RpoP
MTPEIACKECGSGRLTYPFHITDDSSIECQECGSVVGTVAELRVQAGRAGPSAGSTTA